MLTNPKPKNRLSSGTVVPFKQIQTGDYPLSKTQDNISGAFRSLSVQMGQSTIFVGRLTSSHSYSVSTTPQKIIFPTVWVDSASAYNSATGVYMILIPGVYAISFSASFNISAIVGAAFIELRLFSDVKGVIGTTILPVTPSRVSANPYYAVNMATNEQLYWVITTDIGTCTLDISNEALISANLLGGL
jgi:hypothetical protein